MLIVAVGVILAFLWKRAGKKPLSNVTTVTIMAVAALICLGLSHFAMYIKIFAALFAIVMWFLAYRFREQGPVAVMALLGLGAIVILSG